MVVERLDSKRGRHDARNSASTVADDAATLRDYFGRDQVPPEN